MNRQNKKRISLLLGFCLLITMGGFGNLKCANAADATMAVADAEPTKAPTDVKNANDVAAINMIIADQRAKGATVSENLDDTNQYTWKDGRLVEIKWISKLDTTIDYKLTGDISFNDLTALETIDCSVSYGLTSIEVTDCKALKALKISHSQITTLNIENNVVLQKLDCSCTEISDLDVSHNPELEELDCSSIPINCLDVSHNPELENLECGETQIKHLDVSKLANLQSLSCNSLEIESLDLSSNKKLEELSFDFCEHISNIDLSNNVMLREVSCAYSSINALDVSKNVALEKLDCYNTNIQSLDVSKNVELQFLRCDSTKLTTLDVTCNTKLEYLSCSCTDILYVDIRKCSKMTKEDVYCDYEMLIVYNEETAQIVPECVALHKIVTEQRALGAQIDDYWNGEDYYWENGHLVGIDLCQRGLKGKISFAGLPALRTISIIGNEITELDVSNIPDLKCLKCEDNKITRLDIRNNKKLTKFTYDDGVKVIRTDDDLEPSVKPSAAPSVTPTARPSNKPQKTTAPAAVGTTLKDKSGSYKVVSSNKKQPTISYVQSAKTKTASVTVPDKVTIGGVTYKVTAIAPKAFANNKKLKKVTISKNITSIGKNAFAGCKKLKKITIKSTKLKSKSIGKNAFKGTAKNLVINVPKKQYKAYKKFLKKKGNKTVKVKKY
ncbi:leucine-rich repeat protein [uncultured Ruminococcus sp.]|uniref:leucine-rich repeat protein n=1 Tax=uncultured Ruminococcus sp. TaxID=165186 RepID=UPI00266D2F37|nr:leucine-rich repeat protein [uncultured Ruminococcus sp.]